MPGRAAVFQGDSGNCRARCPGTRHLVAAACRAFRVSGSSHRGATKTPQAPPARATWPEGDAHPICSLPAAPKELPTTPQGRSRCPQHPDAPQRTGWPSPAHPPSARSLGPCLVRLSPKLSGSTAATGPMAVHLLLGARWFCVASLPPTQDSSGDWLQPRLRAGGPQTQALSRYTGSLSHQHPSGPHREPSDRSRLARRRWDHRAQDAPAPPRPGTPHRPEPPSTGKLEA